MYNVYIQLEKDYGKLQLHHMTQTLLGIIKTNNTYKKSITVRPTCIHKLQSSQYVYRNVVDSEFKIPRNFDSSNDLKQMLNHMLN